MKMEESFEALISSYLETKVGIAEHFLSDTLSGHLKENILNLHKNNLMRAAGTGKTGNVIHNTDVRSDSIYWLDRNHNNKYENDFLDKMDAFVLFLNTNCYAGIKDYEFHYTIYEKGSYYKKHIDQFQNNQNRAYSIISYLNEGWTELDNGYLLIYLDDQEQKIAPTNGKTVFFKSNEIEHEVMITNTTRLSITGWLKT